MYGLALSPLESILIQEYVLLIKSHWIGIFYPDLEAKHLHQCSLASNQLI